MRAIFKRELRACFQSVIGWLFLAATLGIYFLYFYAYNLSYGYPYISYALSAMQFIFLVTVPLLTMRTLAEERHARTDQLILTAPVGVGKIVLGKYLALAAVFSLAAAVIALTPLLLGRFGTAAYSESYVALLGFWLYGLACIAIGVFVSALTESQVIAAVVTFVFLFVGYMMDGITNLISSGGNLLTKLLNCYNLTAGLDKLSSGELDLTAVVYYVSLGGLFLFLTIQAIQKRRWTVSVRRIGMGVFNTGFVAAAIALVVILNLVAGTLPSTVTSIDCTKAQLYGVTDDTKNILAGLSDDVTLYVLANESTQDKQLARTLQKYAELSKKVTVDYKDPAVSPNFYQQYTDGQTEQNSVIAVCGDRSKVINYSDMYETSVDYQTYQSQTTGYDAEGQLTSAIQYVTSSNLQTVYEITGHGETSLTGGFRDAVEKMNLNIQSLTLLETDALPKDCEAVIINGPTSDFSADDAKKIMDYLADGGKALITTQYTTKKLTNFEKILSAYKLTLADGMVVETDSGHYYQNPLTLLPDIGNTELTADVSDGYVLMPYAQGLTYPQEAENLTFEQLLAASQEAYVKKDVANMQTFDKEDGDTDGPFTLGVLVTDEQTGAQLIVYTSAMLLDETADSEVSGNNAKLFAASVGALAGDDETDGLVVIPVKEYNLASLVVPRKTAVVLMSVTLIALPLALLAAGIVIWCRRRKA